ncbi:hypothetical protein GCM10011390_01630 [Aureimonas endophytica]|uniref:DUF1289 domain-containing protein n=1 Tax=Aureimonas endophytica TaxID=2027858 RepID=A0A916ZCU2_9HYPH|nr:DUF1289 domain-containing protein [Aureimonas endophytica]GGD86706.1 hypothetical protein GCM10011390_01630 [Aureimonas endophytica]
MSPSSPATDSPCIRLCRLDPATGFCIGCGRTLDEIAGWAGSSGDERRAILARLPARLAELGAARETA